MGSDGEVENGMDGSVGVHILPVREQTDDSERGGQCYWWRFNKNMYARKMERVGRCARSEVHIDVNHWNKHPDMEENILQDQY